MNITIFTGNQPRHNYLINSISKVANKVFVIQEVEQHKFINKKKIESKNLKEKYFDNVNKAELKCFGTNFINVKNIEILSIIKGHLNNYDLEIIKNFCKSDIYVIFGSSIIKGKLFKFLTNKKTYNIHMGISPFYRGADCNFWALYDQNYNMIGASIIKLSKKN